MQTIPECQAAGTISFDAALHAEAETLTRQFPHLAARLAKAAVAIEQHRVYVEEDGHTAMVQSKQDAATWYHVNGDCPCPASEHRTEVCYHRLALRLYQKVCDRRAVELMHTPVAVPTEATSKTPGPSRQADAPSELPEVLKRHIVWIQNKPFVKFSGLLELAHQRGLQELKVDWSYNDAELSLAHAVAVFPFGIFEDSGDATPSNTNKKVAPHFRRCALTRASARALRLALGVDLVAVEELSEE
jgi:hypothetical protein